MDECFTESLVYSGSENSDEEETTVPEPNPSPSPEKTTQDQPSHVIDNGGIFEESDEDDMNVSIKKTRKPTKFLSSDDENENSDKGLEETNTNTETQEPTKSTFTVRPSICDSDTKSSSDGSQSDTKIKAKKLIKKLKKKIQKVRIQQKTSDSSESDSDSDAGSSKDDKKQDKKSKKSEASGESSGSDSSSADSNDQTDNTENVKPREKTVQRMSAKMAEQQMKEIQSESQRMARELHINIPYHKPKPHSLKEFLSRRSIVQHQEKLASKPVVKAAVAIKMSEAELIQYMNDMKKREKEAEEFFQEQEETDDLYKASDSDESDEYTADADTKTDKTEDDKTAETNTEELPSEAQANECEHLEANPKASAAQEGTEMELDLELDQTDACTINNEISETVEAENDSINQNDAIETPNVIELHTEPTELDDELDAMSTNKKVKLTFPSDFVPKLKGEKGFVIDLETNDVKPTPKTGVDELFERFMENAIAKPQRAETQDIGIFRTDTGSIERHTVHVNVDNIKPTREPRPGESLFKLRAELGKKIKENREKLIAQRLQEEKEQELSKKQMESEDDDEEFDDLSDNEKDTYVPDEEINELDQEQPAMDETNDVDECMEGEDIENSEDSEIEDVEIDTDTAKKTRKRILIAMDDDDSDTEIPTNSATIEDLNVSKSIDNQSTQLPTEEGSKGMNISALESEILQLSNVTDSESNAKKETSKLFEECNEDYEEIGESQLMALCSGSFATQHLDVQSVQPTEPTQKNKLINESTHTVEPVEDVVQTKPVFLSSDEEESNENVDAKKKSKKKRKQQTLVYSDDEAEQPDNEPDPPSDIDECQSEEQESIVDEEEDLGERYIEYDSDENEVEVKLKKIDVRNKASEYVENEAELSESEWGSEDEDEKGLANQYEAELGDIDKFDKEKLRGELERIRLREQIDQDSREIRILTERFIEEEEGGQERERKFRWKHLNNIDLNDDQHNKSMAAEDVGADNSDEENEATWRRMRYEREQLLKQQMNSDKDVTIEEASTTIVEQAINKTTTILNASKRISIIKPAGAVATKTTSPFLITKGELNLAHYNRKSFLNRDSPILEKLASLSKAGTENDAILNTAKGKGNYVFVATEKRDSIKRKSDSETGGNLGPGSGPMMNPSKKSKLDPNGAKLKPHTKAFFASLN